MKRLPALLIGSLLSCAAFADATSPADFGGSSSGGTPANGSVTLAMLANLNADTLICNPTGSGAAAQYCTVTQIKTLLAYSFSDLTGSVSAAQLPNPGASSLGGVQSFAAVTHQFVTQISTAGVVSAGQPAFGDLTGSATCPQMPALTGNVTMTAGQCATVIPAGTVTLAMQANLTANSIQGNNTGSGAPPIALSVAQVQAMIGISSGSYSAPPTGFTSLPACTINYEIAGGIATLEAFSACSATSNSTAMTLPNTNTPTALKPAHTHVVPCYPVEDNSATTGMLAFCSIASTGVVSFILGGADTTTPFYIGGSAGGTASFTASGTKGLLAGWTMIYPLD